jgi:hypothetical protein
MIKLIKKILAGFSKKKSHEPTQAQLNSWHYSQGPISGTEYPKK